VAFPGGDRLLGSSVGLQSERQGLPGFAFRQFAQTPISLETGAEEKLQRRQRGMVPSEISPLKL